MGVAAGIGGDVGQELGVDRRQVFRRPGQAGPEPSPRLRRRRLPDGLGAQVLQMVEHVVQHAMALGAQVAPVLGVQAGFGLAHWGSARPRERPKFIDPGLVRQSFPGN